MHSVVGAPPRGVVKDGPIPLKHRKGGSPNLALGIQTASLDKKLDEK